MVKLVALLKAKEGLSQEEFENYYEKYHVPLVLKHLPQIAHYRRNYVVPDTLLRTQHMSSDAPPPEFNVITEAWFEDMEDYYAMAATTSDPAIAKIIADDEENFLDRGAMTMFLVNERITK